MIWRVNIGDCYRIWLWLYVLLYFFFFKQKTAYEMRISDWSSDVCSSDLRHDAVEHFDDGHLGAEVAVEAGEFDADRARSDHQQLFKIGRASCRERVCQYV